MYGVKHHYGVRHLEKVPNSVLSVIPDNPAVITLRAAAKAVSTEQDQLEHTTTLTAGLC